MQYDLIHKNSISTVLEKARQYRSLLEPDLAISICIDVFAVDENNQEGLIVYILALTDKLGHGHEKNHHKKIKDTINKLESKFSQHYYMGIFLERKARALLKNPLSKSFAYDGFIEAIEEYKLAKALAPKDCSDPILRYNSCIRTIEKNHLKPQIEHDELY